MMSSLLCIKYDNYEDEETINGTNHALFFINIVPTLLGDIITSFNIHLYGSPLQSIQLHFHLDISQQQDVVWTWNPVFWKEEVNENPIMIVSASNINFISIDQARYGVNFLTTASKLYAD